MVHSKTECSKSNLYTLEPFLTSRSVERILDSCHHISSTGCPRLPHESVHPKNAVNSINIAIVIIMSFLYRGQQVLINKMLISIDHMQKCQECELNMGHWLLPLVVC